MSTSVSSRTYVGITDILLQMPKRYFTNNFGDFAGQLVPVANERLNQLIVHLSTQILQEKLSDRSCDGGLYVGLGGISYSLWYLSSKSHLAAQKAHLLSESRSRIEFHIKSAEKSTRRKTDHAAFLLGNSGLYLAGALICHDLGEEKAMKAHLDKFAACADIVLPVDFLSCGGDELLVGRAGYLCGVLNLRLKLSVPVISDETLVSIFRSMIESGRRYATQRGSKSPLMYSYYETEYLGAAHGLAGILQMLLSFPHILERVDKNAVADVRGAVDYYLSIQIPNGNFPCATDEIGHNRGENELVHWCHGAPGAIYLFARAYKVWNEQKYLDACIKCGDVIWHKGLLKKGPGVCHGVAGNGYAFLLLYRLTEDPKHLHRAHRFAEFINSEQFKNGARTPDCPLSLFEGLAGTVCFYSDLLEPEKSEFPLFPVFF